MSYTSLDHPKLLNRNRASVASPLSVVVMVVVVVITLIETFKIFSKK